MEPKPVRLPSVRLLTNFIRGGPGRWLPWRALLPTTGSALFTVLLVGALIWAQSAGAFPAGRGAGAAPAGSSISTIAYQGRLADSAGNPLTGSYPMFFRLYDVASGGIALWAENWTGGSSVVVSDGLFNVMLGSLTSMPPGLMTANSSLWLGITVGTDSELAPRVQFGSVPFAIQALTVPDGSVTTARLADGAVTSRKLAPVVKTAEDWGGNYWNNSNPDANVNLPGAVVSLTADDVPITSTLLVWFSGHFENTAGAFILADVCVDGVERTRGAGRSGSGRDVLSLTLSSVVAPGAHSVDVRFRPYGGGTATATNYSLVVMVVAN
jgi:hypothetical protein